jgi:hypothetical protein
MVPPLPTAVRELPSKEFNPLNVGAVNDESTRLTFQVAKGVAVAFEDEYIALFLPTANARPEE